MKPASYIDANLQMEFNTIPGSRLAMVSSTLKPDLTRCSTLEAMVGDIENKQYEQTFEVIEQ
jgi:hypothetical protein